MLPVIITAVTILLISLARDVTSSRDSVRSNDDAGMLRELLQRIDKMQNHMDKMQNLMDNIQTHIDRIERNVDRIEINVDQMITKNSIRFDKLDANDQNLHDNTKNLSVVMETIVEQQMVITAEIFTVSQTLPFCCCQYQNTTDPPEIKTTTTDSGKPETTTPTTLTTLPMNCAVVMGESGSDGIYEINVTDSDIGPFDVYCTKNVVDSETEKDINGTWMIIQRRQDNTTDFYRNWSMYQRGFGDLNGNFWIGLDKLYVLTKSTEQELWVQLKNTEGLTGWAKYSHFSIGSESEKYSLKTIGLFVGNVSDSLSPHKSLKWTTYDNDNDNSMWNCAELSKGAWWYDACFDSNLNGLHYGWIAWLKFGHCKYTHMALRPRK